MLDYLKRNAHYVLPTEWGAAYRHFTQNGMLVASRQLSCASLNPTRMPQLVVDALAPKTLLDVGCGTGQTLDFFLAHGVNAYGIEGSKAAIRSAKHPERIIRHDLRKPPIPLTRFDVVWCFEVAEHIAGRYVENFLGMLLHAPTIVLSAAPPGQGGEGHFNEQPVEYWRALFRARGYALDDALTQRFHATGEFYAQNVMVYQAGDML